ncbi:MAG: hypothetical protein BYD32DRAFT_418260 [Podila humilis]|nr:MAG: hypothetical protein BYD32DRAFT_418260 [Podila humilis]
MLLLLLRGKLRLLLVVVHVGVFLVFEYGSVLHADQPSPTPIVLLPQHGPVVVCFAFLALFFLLCQAVAYRAIQLYLFHLLPAVVLVVVVVVHLFHLVIARRRRRQR